VLRSPTLVDGEEQGVVLSDETNDTTAYGSRVSIVHVYCSIVMTRHMITVEYQHSFSF
jgi:hypothetical protein